MDRDAARLGGISGRREFESAVEAKRSLEQGHFIPFFVRRQLGFWYEPVIFQQTLDMEQPYFGLPLPLHARTAPSNPRTCGIPTKPVSFAILPATYKGCTAAPPGAALPGPGAGGGGVDSLLTGMPPPAAAPGPGETSLYRCMGNDEQFPCNTTVLGEKALRNHQRAGSSCHRARSVVLPAPGAGGNAQRLPVPLHLHRQASSVGARQLGRLTSVKQYSPSVDQADCAPPPDMPELTPPASPRTERPLYGQLWPHHLVAWSGPKFFASHARAQLPASQMASLDQWDSSMSWGRDPVRSPQHKRRAPAFLSLHDTQVKEAAAAIDSNYSQHAILTWLDESGNSEERCDSLLKILADPRFDASKVGIDSMSSLRHTVSKVMPDLVGAYEAPIVIPGVDGKNFTLTFPDGSPAVLHYHNVYEQALLMFRDLKFADDTFAFPKPLYKVRGDLSSARILRGFQSGKLYEAMHHTAPAGHGVIAVQLYSDESKLLSTMKAYPIYCEPPLTHIGAHLGLPVL